MLKNLFTSSFKKLPHAFILFLLIVCGIEYTACQKYENKFFSHEVDLILYRLKEKKFNADFLLIGDSVGLQLLRQYSRNPEFAVFATNQAIEITGQYFLIKRYIEKNPPPKAVIFASRPFQNFNLQQVYTENFVLRTFTQFNEILSVFFAKHDFTMLTKMIAYKLLFTYKHRLKIQNNIMGFTNADIYSGVDMESGSFKYNRYSLLAVFDKAKKTENTASYHFKDLLRFLSKKNIDFYYIPVPIAEGSSLVRNYNESLVSSYNELFFDYLPSLQKKYSNLHYFHKIKEYPNKLFVDHVHFNEDGMSLALPYMSKKVNAIVSNYSK